MSETKAPKEASKENIQITAVSPLNGRSLRLEFSDGSTRLFDRHRLRGPQFIPLMNEEFFTRPVIKDGDLGWEGLDITAGAQYVYSRSVPYDDHARPKEYVPTKKDIYQERLAAVLFPLMAAAGIFGIVWWFIHQ